MRKLGREEELEDTVSHLSIYLTGLDRLYHEQAAQLKHQIRMAEKAEQELESQKKRAIKAEEQAARSQTITQNLWQRFVEERGRRREAGLLEGEPEKFHWEKGTQTEDEVLEQYLPPKKHPIRIQEESP
jgi:polyphosphate kinase